MKQTNEQQIPITIKWNICAIDIKIAFLQGDNIDHKLFAYHPRKLALIKNFKDLFDTHVDGFLWPGSDYFFKNVIKMKQ